jgi:methionyl-tRNA synthetase
MSTPKRYTITAALPYANGPKHIGHLAGAYLPADVYARYLRLNKRDVLFVCGSDEHGTAIANQAIKEKTTPREIVDKYHKLLIDCFEQFGIQFDIYHRTSDPLHHETAQAFFKNMNDRGLLEEKTTEQFYDEEAQQFLADRYITGTCPNCSHPKAYGDQCEKCGSSLNPEDLISPRSTLSGQPPVLRPTKHWYLPLDKYEKWLNEWIIEGHKDDWKTNVYGQCKSWIEGGLHPRAVTRDLDWGVKVPVEGADGKVLYVWFDAPIGYISATRQWGINSGKDWEPYWKDADTKLVHFIGKDNIVFHCIIFPVMLHAHGEFILPDNVPANEFLNLEGDKMSTSGGWSIEMHEYLADFPGKADELRYTLLANLPESKDSEFTWKDYQLKCTSELADIFSNFVHRTMTLVEKNFAGKVPDATVYTKEDLLVLENATKFPALIGEHIESYHFRDALKEFMNLARLGNKYLTDAEPWKIKNDDARVGTILNVSLQLCASLGFLSEPFLPFTSQKLLRMLNLQQRGWDAGKATNHLPAGHQLNAKEMLFQKVDESMVKIQLEKLEAKRAAVLAAQPKIEEPKKEPVAVAAADLHPLADICTFDDFQKMDIRVGTIIEAEKMPKSDKLLKLKVDIGHSVRTILSGIAKHYSPEQVIGQQVTVLVNLAPRKMMGTESEGMILMAENKDGELSFVAPTKGHMHNGGIVK